MLDGSVVQHTDRNHDDGVGPIGTRCGGARGLKVMAAIAMTPSGVPLGVAAHHLWARSEQAVGDHMRRALEAKESQHWIGQQRAFESALDEVQAGCRVLYVMDAEADAWPVLQRALEGTRFLIRLAHDRNLAALDVLDPEHHKPLKALALAESSDPIGHMWVALRRRGHHRARLACLTLRTQQVSVRLRAQWTGRHVGDVPLSLVLAREEDAPAGEEPIEWALWTTEATDTFEGAVKAVRTYALRFRIERVFYAAKTGLCETERAQLESFEALARWITLKLSVAVRAEACLEASRSDPDVPADREFTREEIDGALLLHQQWCRGKIPVGTTPTLGQMVTLVAQLGGYTGKSSGGPPGIKTFSRGMERVQVAAGILLAQRGGVPPDPT